MRRVQRWIPQPRADQVCKAAMEVEEEWPSGLRRGFETRFGCFSKYHSFQPGTCTVFDLT